MSTPNITLGGGAGESGTVAPGSSTGWVYCLSNPVFPGLLKVGVTGRTPEERAKELFSTGVPLPFKIEFAKKVAGAFDKERTLHALLEQYSDRVNRSREFFRISAEEVRKFFDLMDGEMWVDGHSAGEEDEEVEEDEEAPREKASGVPGCRDMAKCFTDGQRIRHTIGINKTWTGVYDTSKNGIVCNGTLYGSLSSLACAHNRAELPHRATNTANGWRECKCEVDGEWISTLSLPG